MKSKIKIRQTLIKEFGENFNTIDNLIEWLKKHYHPQIFATMSEFIKTPYFHIKGDVSIDEYTDGYIKENDDYIIVLFDDYRDFKCANESDNFSDDIIVCYDKQTNKIIKYYYTGFDNEYLHDIDAFI